MSEEVLDLNFKRELARIPGAERVMSCYLCGTCTASCPVAEVDAEYNPRGIVQRALWGLEDELLHSPDLWKCTQCHNCVAHCPQDVRLADVIRALRVMAVQKGAVTQAFADKIQDIDNRSKLDRLERINSALEQERR